jgi:small subunit ribosomal protein S2
MEEKGKKIMSVELIDLLKAGVHFGHVKSKRHPSMEPYIFGVKQGIHIIDLEKTQAMLDDATKFANEVTSKGGVILFVSSKKQAKSIVKEAAEKAGMPYINTRWLGGTLTNFNNIISLTKKLKKLEDEQAKGDWERYTKKEALENGRKIIRLKEMVEGIKNITKLPNAIFIVDIKKDKTALSEAAKMNIPVVSILDSNCNAKNVKYGIPGNDDAVKSITLITNTFADACVSAKK